MCPRSSRAALVSSLTCNAPPRSRPPPQDKAREVQLVQNRDESQARTLAFLVAGGARVQDGSTPGKTIREWLEERGELESTLATARAPRTPHAIYAQMGLHSQEEMCLHSFRSRRESKEVTAHTNGHTNPRPRILPRVRARIAQVVPFNGM